MIRLFIGAFYFIAFSSSVFLTPEQQDVLQCPYDIGLEDFTGLLVGTFVGLGPQ